MHISEIHVRDPFILPYDGKYYLYGTRGETCWGLAKGFDCYISEDLENFDGPFEIFDAGEDFWADRHFWAPEVHLYNAKFYMFASFKSEDKCRGTQILVCDTPNGTFKPLTDSPVTPHDWECLDGTLYVDESGTPYIVFCHEWLQIQDGTMCAMELSKDLTHAVSEPFVLFSASEAKWAVDREGKDCYITDGPFLVKENGMLLMIWSSFGKEGYVQGLAVSENGTIKSHFKQLEPLFVKDGGHGMIFKTFEGQHMLILHSPNDIPLERPKLIPISFNSDSEHPIKIMQ